MDGSLFTGQLRSIFIEETEDGLDLMERGLLQLDAGSADRDLVNAVFRAAHSIKGGAGTFSLTAMVELTHLAESLLEDVRSGERAWTSAIGSALLGAVDELRDMLDAVREGSAQPPVASPSLLERLRELNDLPATPARADAAEGARSAPAPDPNSGLRTLQIEFRPHAALMRSGNDPLLILAELARLGEIETTCHQDGLPAFSSLDPHDLYLRWDVRLKTSAPDDEVREVFAWVEDECDLEIARVPAAAPPDPAATPRGPSAQARTQSLRTEQTSIRVGVEKVDALVDMVGELVITQSMLSQVSRSAEASSLEALRAGVQQLERNTRELQEGIMRMRMLPIGFVFARLPRLVRDLGRQLGKPAELVTIGEATEIDKNVLEQISDPLVHLVRNCVDHGLESPEERRRWGKDPVGLVRIEAAHQGGAIVIRVRDDGAGIDPAKIRTKAIAKGLIAETDDRDEAQLLDLIFMPGFSTAETVSDISGRGVGMDVVRRNIHQLGGTIEIASKVGVGTELTIRLPLTLAILDGQLFRLGRQTYVLPLVSVVESFVPTPTHINHVANGGMVYRLRDAFLPILRLSELFNLPSDSRSIRDGLMIVTEGSQGPVVLHVDELLGQQQVVIKSLESNFGHVQGVAGATILGNGSVALIIDVPGLVRLHGSSPSSHPSSGTRAA